MGPLDLPHTPISQVLLNGAKLNDNLSDRVLDINVELVAGDGAQDGATIIFDDRDWAIQRPNKGDILAVYLGYAETGLAFMGNFELDEVRFGWAPKIITVHGNTIGLRGPIKSPKTQEFDNKTLGEIVQKLGADTGMSVTVDPDLAGIKVPFMNLTASPMHVLSNLERQFGGVLKVSDGKIAFGKRDGDQTASGERQLVIQLGPSDIANCEIIHRNRSEYSETAARYKDGDDTKSLSEKSQITGAGDLGDAPQQSTPFAIPFVFPTKDQAQKAARSQQDALDRTLGEGLFQLAQGDPWIRDQYKIIVTGSRDGIDGSYIVDIAQHTYSKESGLKTSLRTRSPSGGSETSFPLPFSDGVLQPGPGQVTGDVLPVQGNSANSDPLLMPGNTEAGGRRQ